MATNKVILNRFFTAVPEKVYKAFTDADAMASWLPPFGFVCKIHHLDPQEGGTYRMSLTNFTTGHSHSFGGEFLEISLFEYLRYSYHLTICRLNSPINIVV